VAEGGRASLAIATTATIEINGVSSPLDLTKKASRLLAENAALVEAAASRTVTKERGFRLIWENSRPTCSGAPPIGPTKFGRSRALH